MWRHALYCVVAAASLHGLGAAQSNNNDQSQQGQSLFNGKDRTGWRISDGGNSAVWGVGNGILFASEGGAGFLMTAAEFGDFDLRLEYRLPRRGRSGVAIRSALMGDPLADGLTIALADDESWKERDPKRRTGALYDLAAPSRRPAKPAGQWNKLHIIARGKQITVELNGTKVVDANLDKLKEQGAERVGLLRKSGHIGLQSGEGSVEFRNLFAKDLGTSRQR
jgi:Domain of Unknown Function (DUF1080)